MKKPKAYQSYFGGKNGNGTYQTIINHIPPHRYFCSLFLGNCGVTQHIRPAQYGFLNDIDEDVYTAWFKIKLPDNYELANNDAIDLIKEPAAFFTKQSIPNAETFLYFDPPYLKESRKSQANVYRHEMTKGDHIALLSRITAMSDQGFKIMISCYPNELYEMWLNKWNQHSFYSTIRNGVALERIYYNYELTGELHDYSYIGEDFREREALARIKRNFVKKFNRLPVSLKNAILQEISKDYNFLTDQPRPGEGV